MTELTPVITGDDLNGHCDSDEDQDQFNAPKPTVASSSPFTLVVENEELRARIHMLEEEMDSERDRILCAVQKKLLEKDEVLDRAQNAIKALQTQLKTQIQKSSASERKLEEVLILAAALEGRSRDREALASECAALRERTKQQAHAIRRLQKYIRKLEGCEQCGKYPIYPGLNTLE